MRVNLFCPIGHEPWDHRSPDTQGIGGSETCVVEMSWRLAQRGYAVTVFGHLGADCPTPHRGVAWRELETCDPTQEALWIVCRSPQDVMGPWQGQVWLMCQDTDYPGQFTPGVCSRVDVVMAMSQVHARNLAKAHPEVARKVRASSNGIRVDLFEAVEREGIERRPHSLMFASSPDRGLVQAVLPLWPRIRERVPDAELHVYYGFDNIEKMVAADPVTWKWLGDARDKCLQYFEEYKDQGVTWHGRVTQRELCRAWLSSAVWPQFSDFAETSAIACMEAQAGGAIPVTRPWWAVGENVRNGVFVNGSCYSSDLARARLVDETCALLLDEELQDTIRPGMMEEARIVFDWERIVDQWQQWIHGWPPNAKWQYAFQHQHLETPAINIGANNDASDLKSRGEVVNVDCREVDPGTGWTNKVDLLADATNIPLPDKSFRTAILGDILEHCKTQETARVMVAEAKRLAEKVIITCPEDYRGQEIQHRNGGHFGPMPEDYTPAMNSFHAYPVTREWLEEVAGPALVYQPIRYSHMNGHGVVLDATG